MRQPNTFFRIIWKENRNAIGFVYLLNIIEEVFFLLIPSAVGMLINTFIYGKSYGLLAFCITYIGWQGMATFRKIKDTEIFTDIFNQFTFRLLNSHTKQETTKINARVEMMKQVVDFFQDDLPFVVNSLISIIGSSILLYFYNSKLIFVSVVILIPSLLINYFYSKKIILATESLNDKFEEQVDIIEKGSKDEQIRYFLTLRKLNIRKSSLEAYNFGLIEVFSFLMILISIYIICKTDKMEYGDIVASYGIILRFAYGFDFIPHITTKLATLKDITNRMNEME
jgi:ABC-type multidrug transport system fused ATPase/permease subunit